MHTPHCHTPSQGWKPVWYIVTFLCVRTSAPFDFLAGKLCMKRLRQHTTIRLCEGVAPVLAQPANSTPPAVTQDVTRALSSEAEQQLC